MPDSLAAERRARLRAALAEAGLQALVVYGNAWQGDYLRYLGGFASLEGHAVAIAAADGGVTIYLDNLVEAGRARAECPEIAAEWAPDIIAAVEAHLARIGNQAIGAAPAGHLPRRLAARLADGMLQDATRILDRLLADKLPGELAAVRRAADMADRGYAVFRAAARAGRPQYALVADVEAFFRAAGCPDNFQILGSGGIEVRGMAPPGERRLEAGDLVTTELTPCVDGYYAQICRTLVLGEPSPEQRAAFAVFHAAMEAGIAAVRPGATAADVARAENDVFRRHGLGDYVTSEFTRVRGHGLGLFPDGKPALLEDVTTVLAPGMTLVVHPNTYHPKVGYMVLGDSVVVTERGCEVLTRTPRELFSVPA